MEKCICKEVADRADRGEFRLTDDLLKRYMESKVSRIKQLYEAKKFDKKGKKVVDK